MLLAARNLLTCIEVIAWNCMCLNRIRDPPGTIADQFLTEAAVQLDIPMKESDLTQPKEEGCRRCRVSEVSSFKNKNLLPWDPLSCRGTWSNDLLGGLCALCWAAQWPGPILSWHEDERVKIPKHPKPKVIMWYGGSIRTNLFEIRWSLIAFYVGMSRNLGRNIASFILFWEFFLSLDSLDLHSLDAGNAALWCSSFPNISILSHWIVRSTIEVRTTFSKSSSTACNM